MFAASKSGKSGVATDPYFPYVPVLLETTNTNGQQNNTFLDSSANNFSITRNGTPPQGSVTPYWPDGQWSNYFNGSTDYLSLSTSTAFGLGTGDFTIEMWVYPTVNPANGPGTLYDLRTGATASATAARFNNSRQLLVYNGPSNIETTFTTVLVTLNAWNHIAVVRSSGTVSGYINGQLAGSVSITTNLGTSQPCYIGNNQTAGYSWNGYISNFRVVKGTAVYTAAFTPPNTPLTAITNTQLLTCQSNRFKDNSANNFTITPNGNPTVQTFQPFSPTASYTTAAYVGSGYFNGTTDYLTVPANTAFALSGNFTIEMWVYPTEAIGSFRALIATGGSGSPDQFLIGTDGSILGIYCAGVVSGNSVLPPVGVWTHIAVSRTGTNVYFFLNGVQQGTTKTSSSSALSGTATVGIAYRVASGEGIFAGYISNLRVVKGTGVYTSNFTPPTTPLTAITNTSLLLNCANAGIYDAAVQNNGITVGSAQSSTTQYKWSPTSMKFNGTTDYLTFPINNAVAFRTANFTIEAWVYTNNVSNSSRKGWLQTSDAVGGLKSTYTTGVFIVFGVGAAGAGFAGGVATNIAGTYIGANSAVATTGTWYHIAVTRSSGTARIFVNGTQTASGTASGNCTGTYLCVGGYNSTGFLHDGYIQDLRITNGVARYTSAFSPPTAAFPTR
jgi:hypothetical protein